MIIRYTPGVIPLAGRYVADTFTTVTGGTANGTNAGGGTSPGVALEVNPSVVLTLINGETTITASEPSTFTADEGTFVVAGDSMSAVYTAPGTAGTDTITVCTISDPGDCVEVNVRVLSSYASSIVNAMGSGSLVDSRHPGAYSGSAAPAPPSPVLLPDLVAGWALTGGPQQTLDSTGVIASGPLDWTEDGTVSYVANGAKKGAAAGTLFQQLSAALVLGDSPWLAIAKVSGAAAAQWPTWGYEDYFGSYFFYSDPTPIPSVEMVDPSVNYISLPSVLPYTGNPVMHFAWYDPATNTLKFALNEGLPVSTTLDGGTSTPPLAEAFARIGFGNGAALATIGLCRLYIGANALTIANDASLRAWIANMSGGVALGRTDAEIAAYTG